MPFQPNRTFLAVLSGSAVFAVALPLIIFLGARVLNNSNGQYQQQQQQQQQQNYYDQQYAQRCGWWQWGCRDNYQYNQNNSRDDERVNATPWWWPWSEDERRRDPEDAANPTLVVIYLWTLVLLASVVYYGARTVRDFRDLVGLMVAFAMLANFSMVSMLFLGSLEGGVMDDGRVIEEQGFYGQFGVLLFLTNFFVAVFAVTWFVLTRRMIQDQATTKVNVGPEDYMRSTEVPTASSQAEEGKSSGWS